MVGVWKGLLLTLCLAGCGSDPSADGGVSASEARALNEAAAQLDAQAERGGAGSDKPTP